MYTEWILVILWANPRTVDVDILIWKLRVRYCEAYQGTYTSRNKGIEEKMPLQSFSFYKCFISIGNNQSQSHQRVMAKLSLGDDD